MAGFRQTQDLTSVTARARKHRKGKSSLKPKQKREVRAIAKNVLKTETNTRQNYTNAIGLQSGTPAAAAPFDLLNGMVHGSTDDSDFDGNEIDVQGIDMRFHLVGNVNVNVFRIIVFQLAGGVSGAAPGPLFPQILHRNTPNAFYDTDKVGKGIRILHDSKTNISPETQNSDHSTYFQFHIDGERVKNPGYDVGTGTFVTNGLYFYIASSSNLGVNVSYEAKVSYKTLG